MSESEVPLFSLFHIGISIHQMNKMSERRSGLSLVQWCILKQLIDMPGASAQALAKAVGVHPSTLTQTLKRLERKTLIFIGQDPKDSRKKLVSITRKGRDILETSSQDLSNWSKDLSELKNELRKIRSCLDHHVQEPNNQTRLSRL